MTRNVGETMNVLVVGASGGVGSRLARRLDALGHRVFAGARRADDVAGLGERVTPVALDLTDDGSIAAAAERVRSHLHPGGLDGLVNAAGMIVQGPLELVSSGALRRQFDVNVVGPLAVVREFLPDLRRRHGRIVNVGAATGRTAVPFYGPVSASKAALASLTDVLRMELRHLGVDVVLVEPGAMETQIFDRASAFARDDEDAAGSSARAVYAGAVAAAARSLADAKRSSPDLAVDAIVEALTARRPAARVLVGRDARSLSSLRWAPTRARDRLLTRALGFTSDAFADAPRPDHEVVRP